MDKAGRDRACCGRASSGPFLDTPPGLLFLLFVPTMEHHHSMETLVSVVVQLYSTFMIII